MSTDRPFLPERVLVAVLAVIAATVLWWSVSGARPADKVLDAHQGVPCVGCHMTSTSPAAAGVLSARDGEVTSPAAADEAPAARLSTSRAPSAVDRQCAACHARLDRASTLAAVFHGPQGGACTACHSFHDPGLITAAGRQFRHAFGEPPVRMQCASCHTATGELGKITEGHRDAAAAVYHVDSSALAGRSPSESCLRCHSRRGADPNLPAAAAQAPRFHEEATHPYGETLPAGYATGGYSIRKKVDARIVLFEGRIECQTCHAVADDVEDLLVRFETKYDMCLGCHQRHPSGSGPTLAAGLSAPSPASLAGLN